ncbi:SipW-dependent-type signal peptide-containing protein [Microbacterium capsulatum]|uniref:SipW-dependent-type signal peptide-containing protein n=1 Tax=Microbacterium capsulatum TaxID=3041921 RepID=A0ABU0XGN9_9MICO|nr:SipW-dependent-type signal peptide-containing protein [Microbacterium sp. ASV81]MDQ4214300.1 SipW-dependent-type signal peptide-containing protein [Microbacterium sp. ASV81]
MRRHTQEDAMESTGTTQTRSAARRIRTTASTRKKVLALLAGGLALGVGTAVTLASWNDSEFATGTFTAGTFNIQGSTTSATTGFSDHNVNKGGTAATLGFTAPFSNISPGDVVYAPFWVRLDGTTTNNATLVASAETGSGTNDVNVSYAVYSVGPAAACDATAVTGGTLVASGSDLTGFTAGASVSLAKGASAGTAGTAAQLCVVATAKSTLVQGATATTTLSFTATSY